MNQCGLYVDKIKIFCKISGCGLQTGALNRSKIVVDGSGMTHHLFVREERWGHGLRA